VRRLKPIFYGWWIVVAAGVGLAVSPGPIALSSLGILIEPLTVEFGWDRADVVFANTILTSILILTAPLIGIFIDKVGAKRVLLFSMVAFGAGLWAMTQVKSLNQLYFGYAFIAIGGAGANSLAYMKLLSSWFDKRRGLVMGIATSGMGLGFAIVPPLSQAGIDMFGWQGAYLALGAIILVLGVPCIALLVRNSPEQMNLLPDGDDMPAETSRTQPLVSGFKMGEAIMMKQYWIMLFIFFPVGGVIYAMVVHLVPIIREVDSGSGLAIQAASLLGISMMAGRIVAGYMFDKFFAPAVSCVIFLAAVGGICILMFEANAFWILLASMLIGFCSGAEGDALGYLVSRYFGLRAYGKIYSHAFAAMMLGIAIFPYMMALDYDQTGSYSRSLVVYAALLGVGSILLLLLGPFPSFEKDPPAIDAGSGLATKTV
jgi:predicted MFS family arabinose efflux permease